MAEKDFFHCDQAARRGKMAITKDYCLKKCNSAQRGVKAECPVEVERGDNQRTGSANNQSNRG